MFCLSACKEDVDQYKIWHMYDITQQNNLTENQVDGEALLCITERCLETLIPVMGHKRLEIKDQVLDNKKQREKNKQKWLEIERKRKSDHEQVRPAKMVG